MNKVIKRILTVVIVLVIVFLIAYPKLDLFSESTPQGPAGPPAGQQTLTVDAKIVNTKSVDNRIAITGTILPNESVEITSEVSGKIEQIHFKEGQEVRKGDLLVSLDDNELRAQLEKLRYNQKLFEDTEYRQRQLLEREAISQEEYDQALTSLNTSKADIKVIEAQLEKTKIKAPFAGTIGLRQVSEGAYVTPSEIVTSLFSLNPAKIEFSIPGKYSSVAKIGTKISFEVDGSTQVFSGEVYAIEPQIDPKTRTLKLRATSTNRDGSLLPGQFARISLILESLDDAIMVPTESVIPELNGHKVYLKKDGKVKSSSVQVGLRTESEIQIIQGVTLADTILTSGILQVRPEMPIQVNIVE